MQVCMHFRYPKLCIVVWNEFDTQPSFIPAASNEENSAELAGSVTRIRTRRAGLYAISSSQTTNFACSGIPPHIILLYFVERNYIIVHYKRTQQS